MSEHYAEQDTGIPTNSGRMVKVLDYTYDQALAGLPGFKSVEEMADSYKAHASDLEGAAKTLIRYQVAKASTTGFVTGLGGLITLPVAVPASLSSVLYIQLRMVASIAHMNGYDVHNDQVKTACYVCLAGNSAEGILKSSGVLIGQKLTEQAIKRFSYETIKKINKAVGFRLITKFGHTGAINLGKGIPIVGGVVGGGIDGTMIYTTGRVAKRLFIHQELP